MKFKLDSKDPTGVTTWELSHDDKVCYIVSKYPLSLAQLKKLLADAKKKHKLTDDNLIPALLTKSLLEDQMQCTYCGGELDEFYICQECGEEN